MLRQHESAESAAEANKALDRSFHIYSEAPEDNAKESPGAQRYFVQNRTPWEIRVADPEAGELVLAPLAERIITGARIAPFGSRIRRLRQQHQLCIRPNLDADLRLVTPRGLFGLASLGALVIVALAVIRWGSIMRAPESLFAVFMVFVAVAAVALAVIRERGRRLDQRVADRVEGDTVYGIGGEYYTGDDFTREIWQFMTLAGVVLIGAVLPAVAIYFGTELQDNVSFGNGLEVVEGKEGEVLSRVIQLVYLTVLSLFPALMFFQFDRVRVGTLRGQWVRNIFRLDGRMGSLSEVHAHYGDRLSEASSYSTDSVRFLGGRRSPIMIATILIALGWTMLVLRTDPFDFLAVNQSAAASEIAGEAAENAVELATVATDPELSQAEQQQAAASATEAAQVAEDASATVAEISTGVPSEDSEAGSDVSSEAGDGQSGVAPTVGDEPSDDDPAEAEEEAAAAKIQAEAAAASAELANRGVAIVPFFQLLNPRPSAATMAFLGSYFFALYLVLRGYLRGDLRPKSYSQITTRLITVVIVAYVINAFVVSDASESYLLVWGLAFLAGVTPHTVLRHLGELVGRVTRLGPLFGRAFGEERPLTLIDGVDIYDRERLASEGVSDIEALAHNDLVTTMVSTRIPLSRLIDWTDQAVLILYAQPVLDGADQSEPGASGSLSPQMRTLRSSGVRTATDLLRACHSGQGSTAHVETKAAAKAKLSEALAESGTDLAVLEELLLNDVALLAVQQWRSSEFAAVDGPCRYLDEAGTPRWPSPRIGAETPGITDVTDPKVDAPVEVPAG